MVLIQGEVMKGKVTIKYDSYGRMEYNPIFHPNNGKPWTKEDLQYLIDWYDKIGADEMSFALGRTIKSIMQKVSNLRKDGIMKQTTHNSHKRIFNKKF